MKIHLILGNLKPNRVPSNLSATEVEFETGNGNEIFVASGL